MSIGIATKLSKLEWDMHRLGMSRDETIVRYRAEQLDVGKILDSHERQQENIESIVHQVDGTHVDILAISAGAARPAIDLLIAMGGDNFFQLCAYHFNDAALVGVNTDPQTSHGALTYFDHDSLERKLPDIAAGRYEIEQWTQIATSLNGQRVADASCVVSLAIKATDMVSRYLLKMNGEQEEQKATGILVAAGAGSRKRAWYRNAGLYLPQVRLGIYPLVTQEFPVTARELHPLTREPLGGEDAPYRWLNHTIPEGASLSLVYWANDPSELSIDSVKRYEIKEGDELTFWVSEKPLNVVKNS